MPQLLLLEHVAGLFM